MLLFVHAIDAEQAEAQALHTIRAAVVVDDRKPRLPVAVPDGGGFAAGGLDQFGDARGVAVGDVLETQVEFATGVLELRSVPLVELSEDQE